MSVGARGLEFRWRCAMRHARVRIAFYGVGVEHDLGSVRAAGLVEEVASLRTLTARLQAENARLLRLLELTPEQAAPPGPVQTGFFDARPGLVDRQSPPQGFGVAGVAEFGL